MYDPVLGRTFQLDPHLENYYEWSPYSWTGDNPINMIDPTGMDWYQNSDGEVVNLVGVTGEVEGHDLVMKDDISYILPEVTISSNPVADATGGKIPDWMGTQMDVEFEASFELEVNAGWLSYTDYGFVGDKSDMASVELYKLKAYHLFKDGKGKWDIDQNNILKDNKIVFKHGGVKETPVIDIKYGTTSTLNVDNIGLSNIESSGGVGIPLFEAVYTGKVNSKDNIRFGLQEDGGWSFGPIGGKVNGFVGFRVNFD
jgi:hypothetical protein